MSPKTLVKLALACAILAVLTVLVLRSTGPRAVHEPFGETIKARAARIELVRGNDRVMLEKGKIGWTVSGIGPAVRADAGAVRVLLDGLAVFRVGESVSADSGRHRLFEVDDSSGTRVTVSTGTTVLADLILGKGTPDSGEVYLRWPGKPEVYLASGLAPADVKKEPKWWRSREVVTLDTGELNSVTLTGPKGTVALERSSSTWRVNGRPGKAETVERLLGSAARVYADDVLVVSDPRPAAHFGLARPWLTVTLKTKLGSEVILKVGTKSGGSYYVARADEPAVWLLSETVVNTLNQPASVLR